MEQVTGRSARYYPVVLHRRGQPTTPSAPQHDASAHVSPGRRRTALAMTIDAGHCGRGRRSGGIVGGQQMGLTAPRPPQPGPRRTGQLCACHPVVPAHRPPTRRPGLIVQEAKTPPQLAILRAEGLNQVIGAGISDAADGLPRHAWWARDYPTRTSKPRSIAPPRDFAAPSPAWPQAATTSSSTTRSAPAGDCLTSLDLLVPDDTVLVGVRCRSTS